MMDKVINTQEELNTLLNAHKLWLDSGKKQGKQLDLSEYKIGNPNTRLDFNNMDISYSILTDARFINVNFSSVKMDNVKATYVGFWHSDLSNVKITNSNLRSGYISKDTITNGIIIENSKIKEMMFYSQEILECKYKMHKEWIDSDGKRGEKIEY